jgi:Tfp pilus assembly protein PilF
VAKFDGSVLDTLAWIEHLMGDTATASKRIADAVRRKPDQPDIRLHAALIYAAVNAFGQAKVELAEALRLKPEFATRDDVRELQARLAAGVPKATPAAQP